MQSKIVNCLGAAVLIILAACAAPAVPTPVPPTSIPPTPAPIIATTVPPPMIPTIDSSSGAPRVIIASGELEGVRENNLNVFKGIPYAAPPVGELRWREPQPVAAWNDVRQANAFGNVCIQPTSTGEAIAIPGSQSEDCLYLNVWTPNTDSSAKLPVMFWIHGGALITGASSVPLYDGGPFSSRGAVFVSINYRLGPLGFFSHPALDKEYPNGFVNFGLLDQIAALKWVQQNIASFGGDPSNVMIFGESAGSQSVLTLFASPLARGLFAKGVAESAYGIPSHTRTQARNAGIQVASAVGLNGAEATLKELRDVSAEKLAPLNKKGMSLAPVFVVGDTAVPEPILDVFQKGNEAPVPLIIGNNSDEATVAILFGIDPAKLIEKMGLLKIAVKPLFPDAKDDNQLGRELIRDLIFTAFAKRMADYHAVRAPTWRYYFSYVPQNSRGKEPGVPHGGEIVFVMGTGDIAAQYKDIWTDTDRAMSKRVQDYWFEFARTSKPESSGEPTWTQASNTSDETMEFGNTIALQKNMFKTRLDVLIDLLSVMGKLLDRE